MDETIIDLAAARERRDGPDPEFVKRDDFGRPMFCFAFEYQMAGSTWSFQLWAYSMEDAQDRLSAIRANGALRGQLFVSFPA